MKQSTIKTEVSSLGIGLHKGSPVKVKISALDANSGIVFRRSDLNKEVKASYKNVVNTQMATVLGLGDKQVISTVEHLLSALYAYGIDNALITIDADEVPVFDGSSLAWCLLLDKAGKCSLDANKKVLLVNKIIEVKKDGKFARLKPTNKPKFSFKISFKSPVIGEQSYDFTFSKSAFVKEIASARTFGFLKDVKALQAMGLALGGSLDNAVVIGENDELLNKLRFPDEFVRHKILDAIGDLSLCGSCIFADYESFAGSHELNYLLNVELAKSSNFSYAEVKDLEPELIKAFA